MASTLSYSTGLVHSLLRASGLSFADTLSGFVIDIYSGARPAATTPTSAAADSAVVPSSTVVLLGTVTKSGLPATGDAAAFGLHFGDPALRAIDKAVGETWQFHGAVQGTASWFRVRMPGDTGLASDTAYRIDGSIGTYSADAILSSTAIVTDNVYTLNRFKLTWPV